VTADYRPIDPRRAERIRGTTAALGGGSIAAGAVLLAVAGILARVLGSSGWFALTVAAEGAAGALAIVHGVVAVRSRRAVSGAGLDQERVNATRRDLLLWWNFLVLTGCLGWFAFAVGLSSAEQPVEPAAMAAALAVPAFVAGYTGYATVRCIRLLRLG